ncbi:unnamed protein product [Rotaria socialis]
MSKTESAREHSYIWCPSCSAFQQHAAGVFISCIMGLITMIVCLWRRAECLVSEMNLFLTVHISDWALNAVLGTFRTFDTQKL